VLAVWQRILAALGSLWAICWAVGERPCLHSVVLHLGQYFGIEAAFWLSVQAQHDLAKESAV